MCARGEGVSKPILLISVPNMRYLAVLFLLSLQGV